MVKPINKQAAKDDALRRKKLYTRIPIWNSLEERVITGEEAPMRRNLIRYLAIYRFCTIYVGQDKFGGLRSVTKIIRMMGLDPEEKVMIWDMANHQAVSGRRSPARKNVAAFLQQNPHCEEFVPWEARVTKTIAKVRNRWLNSVRGLSYIHGTVIPKPTLLLQEKIDLRLKLGRTA